jgi:SAM-dependent methyltransferase
MEENRFEQMYREGYSPWHHGAPDGNLARIIARYSIKPCRVLDLGCGMGSNSIWLAQQGFEVHGLDLSRTAIENARPRLSAAGVDCRLQVGNFLTDEFEGAPFGFVFDRGCFHGMADPKDRARFAKNVAAVLGQGGWWLSLIGNADEPKREIGPPRLSALEIVQAAESHFEILHLVSGLFGDNQEDPPRNWICLMRKRG